MINEFNDEIIEFHDEIIEFHDEILIYFTNFFPDLSWRIATQKLLPPAV